MASTLESKRTAEDVPRPGIPFRWSYLPPALLLLITWLFVIDQQGLEWSTNEQYFYGWAIPALCLYLFFQRWPSRPAPRPDRSTTRMADLLAFCCVLFFFPLRFIQSANPDWRLVSWAAAGLGVGLTLALIARAGGRPWVRHFFFPVAFFLVAVPWPSALERGLIEQLMLFNATVASEFLSLLGIPSVREGSIIATAAGKVGVEEACSGIFSLQTSIMMALFLGEFYRLSLTRRIGLLAAGVAAASFFNVGRTLFLVHLAANQGMEAVDRYHDSMGYLILVATLFSLWLLSLFFLKGMKAVKELESCPSVAAPFSPSFCQKSGWVFAGTLAFLAGTEILKESWFRSKAAELAIHQGWTIVPQGKFRQFEPVEIPARARAILRYNDGIAAKWRLPEGLPASVFYFRWEPGRTAAQLVRGHSPDICMPLTGVPLLETSAFREVEINGLTMVFRNYLFLDQGVPFYVFQTIWEDVYHRQGLDLATHDISWGGRLRAVLDGRRNHGQRMLLFGIAGTSREEEAWTLMKQELESIITVGD